MSARTTATMETTTRRRRAASRRHRRLRVLGSHARIIGGVARTTAVAAALAAAPAHAQQTWRINSFLGIQETLTNNVNLQPSSSRRGDLITQLTPGVQIYGQSAHSLLTGSIAVPILLYARTGSENNQVAPLVNLFGTAEFVERFLFVEGTANV